MIAHLKSYLKTFLLRRGWFFRKTLGLPGGVVFETDYLRKAGLPSPRLIFDVGGHNGETCRQFAESFPGAKIISFEPVRQNFETLAANTANLPKVETVHTALGERDESVIIQLQADSQTHSLQYRVDGGPAPSGRTETIRVTTLDAFSEKRGITQIDLLKIDTEGYEISVLKGAEKLLRERAIGAILLEASLDPDDTVHTSLHAASQFLRPHGFQVVAIYDQVIWASPAPRLGYFNALFALSPALK